MDIRPIVTFIIPCYNEGQRLPAEVFKTFLKDCGSDLHFLFVDDGSTDETEKVLREISSAFPSAASFISLPVNSGKGEAVRRGMLHALEKFPSSQYLAFMDADLSTPLEEIKTMREAIVRYSSPAMLMASRIKLFGSTNIQRSSLRHYTGRLIATLISFSLGIAVYDTQCGFKFFRRDVVADLFGNAFISRWLFDVEIIFRLLRKVKGEGNLFEIPLTKWEEKGASKIPLTYAFLLPIELGRIAWKYRS